MILLLIFSSILLSKIQPSIQSNEFIYTGFSNSNITLSGVSNIKTNGLLQLTNDTSRLMGHSFHPSPFKFKNSNNSRVLSFSTSFAFIIVPEYPKLGGHGMAFTVSPSTDFVKSALPSQYLGLLNASDVGNFTNHLFAVEFDTVQDFEFGDINDNHVGININSLQSNESARAGYFDSDSIQQDLNLKSGKTIFVWIEYESETTLINVTISPNSVKPNLPLISFEVDLSDVFRDEMYVGFSASTGLLASSHYVQGWSFRMDGDAKFLKGESLPSLPGIKKKHRAAVIIVSVLAIAAAISLILVTFYVVKKYKNRDVVEAWELEIGPHRYSYKELKVATRRFKDGELLGVGGFGKVYKGTLPNSKTEVAVKRISQESKQGLREFVSEIATIGRLRHRNLVQLLGWCRRLGDLLLVYDYMPNGSLDNFLFDPKAVLNWQQRLNIIKGVASGLLYLHEGYEQIVIHRDIKASNVLLDGELNGRLGDFGLARLYDHGENPSTTRVVGTLGYLAPELPRTGRATTGSDVFAFGALLLEVVCGRRPIEPKAGPEELVLVDWVWGKWSEGNVLEVVDPKMEGEFDVKEVVMVLKLGLMCSNNSLSGRPSMRQVIRFLDGEVEVPEVLRPPNGYDCARGNVEGFDDYMNSFVSSTCDKTSFGSLSTSPVSFLCENRETR